jgi:streptomycin 6-kinase
LPAKLDALAEQWHLTIEASGPEGSCSYIAIVRRSSGEPAILKVPIPHREAAHEAEALRIWDGDAAVRLLELDESGAMLLEPAEPGTPLADLEEYPDMTRIGGEILLRLHRPAPADHPFELLADVCMEWAQLARDRVRRMGLSGDVTLVDEGAELLEALPGEAEESVLLHGDFHHWNVLATTREPWLAIDPKPMVGDPVFDAAQFLGNHHGIVRDRSIFERAVDEFADATGFDRQRMLMWIGAKAAADAMWHLSIDEPANSAGTIEYARFINELRGGAR